MRGGKSSEYNVSLQTGRAVLANLPEDKYQAMDILVDREGVWHLNGLPMTREDLEKRVDVVFNTLHGQYGEDGQVAKFFQEIGIPYVGGEEISSLKSLDKNQTKKLFEEIGIKTPKHHFISWDQYFAESENFIENKAYEAFRKITPPWVVKPLHGGSSINTYFARNYTELAQAIEKVLESRDSVLIEEYINGREIFAGVIENFRDQDFYPLIPMEILKNKEIFDHESRASGDYRIIPTQNIGRNEKELIQDLAVKIHKHFGLRNCSTVDFILSPKGIFALEVDNCPALHEYALMPKALENIGSQLPHFLDHLITLVLHQNEEKNIR